MSKILKVSLAAAIALAAAYIILSSDSESSRAFAEIFGRLMLFAGLVIGAVRTYRQRKARGLSEEELLLEQAGSAKSLLGKTNSNLFFIRLILSSPLLAFFISAWSSSFEIALQVAAMIALPAWPIGGWAYYYQLKIKSYAISELHKSTNGRQRIDPYAR